VCGKGKVDFELTVGRGEDQEATLTGLAPLSDYLSILRVRDPPACIPLLPTCGGQLTRIVLQASKQ
jgi:hypothetical protein